jgi:undecaprenyl-diphosphatase
MTLRGGTDERAGPSMSRLGRFAAVLCDWLPTLFRPPRTSTRSTLLSLGRIAAGAVITAVVVVATMVLFDAAAHAWQKRLSNDIVHLFEDITDFGRSGWVLVPVGVLMLVVAAASSVTLGRMSHLVLAALTVRLGYVFVAVGLTGLVIAVVKRLIGRVRPSDLGPFAYEPFGWKASFASLPSGHTTAAFSALVAIGLVWPRVRLLLLIYALLIAVSRVVVSAHFPSDVIAGAVCGTLGALLVREWFAIRRLGFVICPDGRVNRLPGPSFGRLKRVVRGLFGQ